MGDVEVRSAVIKNFKKFPNFSDPVYFLEAVIYFIKLFQQNVTYFLLLKLQNLPRDQIYCPPIVIRVKDNRKFGRRPTVGQHIITDLSPHIVSALPPPKKSRQEVVDGDGGDDDDEGIGMLDSCGKSVGYLQ